MQVQICIGDVSTPTLPCFSCLAESFGSGSPSRPETFSMLLERKTPQTSDMVLPNPAAHMADNLPRVGL